MGLILMAICPLYLGARLCLLPAELGSIRSWLATIESQRGTFTAAPDFAYRLCVREASHSNRVDLSSLRVALNAAEPVRASTAHAFETAFGLKNVMTSGYGLAEATVGVSISRPGRALRTDGRGLVSVGRPFAGLDVEIVDDGAAQPAGQIGEIAIRGPCNTRGYLNDPAATRGLQWRDGFILTGDYGYLDDAGELFIAGRKKNVIKHAGTTVAPQEIEETVDRLPFVRYSAAVGVDRGGFGGEQVYIFAETRGLTNDAAGAHEAALEVVRAMHACMGFRPGRTYLLRPRTIPRTSNGKVQHALLRERYLDGSLRASGAILYPEY
jgi:acyl-CoA synthetase (AMP-forming)/AMP-acid ligase II